eukprot:gene3698-3958_t
MLHAAALAPCEDRDDEREGQRAKRPRNEDNGARPARADSTGKSELTVLAERFRRDFCTDHAIGRDLNLNDVANTLGVQRRRLYDIVNVLEALQMVNRSGKLTYRWEGTANLPYVLEMLHTDALAAMQHGYASMTVLENHLPGSCWALTRRVVQQLLLDRSQLQLTVLVQRLDAALPAAAAAARLGSGKTSLATMERRLYDIGSVLSTYGLVQKTMQGGR